MVAFTSSKAELYDAKGISKPLPCGVQIEGDKINVMLRLRGQLASFRGREVTPGHFKLKAETDQGEATLHRFVENDVIEGSWSHGSLAGMIRIMLIAG